MARFSCAIPPGPAPPIKAPAPAPTKPPAMASIDWPRLRSRFNKLLSSGVFADCVNFETRSYDCKMSKTETFWRLLFAGLASQPDINP